LELVVVVVQPTRRGGGHTAQSTSASSHAFPARISSPIVFAYSRSLIASIASDRLPSGDDLPGRRLVHSILASWVSGAA